MISFDFEGRHFGNLLEQYKNAIIPLKIYLHFEDGDNLGDGAWSADRIDDLDTEYFRTAALTDVYDQYKHLDVLLSDDEWLPNSPQGKALGDFWLAIKSAVQEDA